MITCIHCASPKTSRWYKGPKCNKCYCKERRTPEFKKRQAEYDSQPHRRAKARVFQKQWYQNNKEYMHLKQTSEEGRKYFREYQREYRKLERTTQYHYEYKLTSEYKAKDNKRRQKSYQRNPGKYKAMVAKRRAAQLQATPKWVDLKAIEQIYRNCPIEMEVDHIIPLQGVSVCGLHVPWNLQYLSKQANCAKKNRLV